MIATPYLLAMATVLGLATTQSIDPSTVPKTLRDTWCSNQKTACPLICLQLPNTTDTPKSNTCNSNTLDYSCVCSNGQIPNATEYSQTIPYYECQESQNQCVTNCNGDSSCQSACRDDHPCGASNPTRVNTSTITTMAATGTATGASGSDVVYTGLGDASSSTSTPGTAPGLTTALNSGYVYGLTVMLGGFLAGFTYIL